MALKQIKLRGQLKQFCSQRAELEEKKKGFEVREADLSQASEEAQTDEDLELVSQQVDDLEKEMLEAAIDEKLEDINSKISEIEEELRELDKAPSNPEIGCNEVNKEERCLTSRGGYNMKRYGIMGEMTREQQEKFITREDVKQFVFRVKALKGETRAVSGAELTIPEIILDLLRDNLHRYSKLITKVRLKPVSGTTRQHILGTIPEGVWMEAIGKLNELSFSINQVEMDGYKVGGFIPVPNSTLEDSDLNLTSEIMDMLGQAIGIAVDKAILYGTGKKMPLGIATRLAQEAKPADWNDNAPAWEDLHTSNILKLDGSVSGTKFFEQLILTSGNAKANYSDGMKVWCMNSATKASVLSKCLAFNAAGAIVAGIDKVMPILGGEIIELEFIPDGDIFFFYGSLYTLAERAGGTFAISEHVFFLEDQTVFKGTARYDGKPVIGKGFLLINIKNTVPTTVISFPPDKANEEIVS